MYTFLKRYYIYILFISLIISTIFLSFENLYKGIFLFITFSLLLFVSIKKKETLTSLPFLFFLIPFNITLQITQGDPYVAGFWVNYLVPTLSVVDIFVCILLIQLIFLSKSISKYIFNKYLIILFLLFLIQVLLVQDFVSTIAYIRLSVYLFTSLLLIEYIKERKILKSLLQNRYLNIYLITILLIQSVVGIYQFLKGTSLGIYFLGESKIVSGMSGSSFIDIQGESFLRAYGTFPHPNVFAGWYILMFLIGMFLYSKHKSKSSLLICILSSISILFTFSRVSILLLLILVLIYVIQKRRIYSFTSLLYYRFLNIFSNEDGSWKDRVELIRVNIEILKKNILLGTGLGNSLREYSDNIPFTQGGKLLIQPVHNIFLLNFVELGILVGTYYIYILYRFFMKGIKLNRYRISILLCILIIGMFDHYLLTLPQGIAILFSFLILQSDLG